MIHSTRLVSLLMFIVLSLAGCKKAQPGDPVYDLAQGCYSVQSVASQQFLSRHGKDGWRFDESNVQNAEAFFLKPTGLSTYLLYDSDQGYLSTRLAHVLRDEKASMQAEWQINRLKVLEGDQVIAEHYTLLSTDHNLRLTLNHNKPVLRGTGDLMDADTTALNFVPREPSECARFPEADLNAEVSPDYYKEKDPSEPVVGYIDMHTHLGFPKAMGGLAMAGDSFHPLGIEHALPDCSYLHGTDGKADMLESQNGGAPSHATAGYPDFTYWPNNSTNTHNQTYYKWLQRAHLNGLKMLVTLVTGNPSFCQVLGTLKFGQLEGDCKSTDSVHLQTQYIYDLQDYIDAQEGGPGKGWFRIVTSPEQARQAISKNQLAVVLGTEYGTLFDCDESNENCTDDYVDQELQKLYDMGIRSIFPIHRFDNAFGGTKPAGGSSGSWMHLTSHISTSKVEHILDLINPNKLLFKPIGGHFWELEMCPAGISGTTGIQSMREFMEEDFGFIKNGIGSVPTVGTALVSALDEVFLKKLEPVPDYHEFAHGEHACNIRPLQHVGKHLINAIIDKGMILEIDHLSYNTLLDTLDVLEQRQYSGFVSSHSWIENNPSIRDRIFRLGGLMAPMKSKPSNSAKTLRQYSAEMSRYPYATGVGIGSDIQGVTGQANGDDDIRIEYPFWSFDGLVKFTEPKTGNRRFDYNTEGVAHYGLYAEWIENLRQIDSRDGDTSALDILMNSAETYLQMWERAERQAGIQRNPAP